MRTTAFDPADTGDAKACVSMYGYIIDQAETYNAGDITQAIPWAYERAFYHRSQIMTYDADGMGAPTMKLTFDTYAAEAMDVAPFHGSSGVMNPEDRYGERPDRHDPTLQTNLDKFANFRSQAATWLRDRFEQAYIVRKHIEEGGVAMTVNLDEIISIDSSCIDLFDLESELSRPKRLYTTNGKIKVEGKKEMKARGISSPNLFDGAMMANAAKVLKKQKGRKKRPNTRSRRCGLR